MEVDLLNKREFCNVIDTENSNGKLFSGRFEMKRDYKNVHKQCLIITVGGTG